MPIQTSRVTLPAQVENLIPRLPVDTPALGRPSKNLGHILNSHIHQPDLHLSITPSNPLPFSIVKQAATTATRSVDAGNTKLATALTRVQRHPAVLTALSKVRNR